MRTLAHPLFIASVLLAAVNQLLERNGIRIPIAHSYLDDLLCFPIVLTVGLASYRAIREDNAYVLSAAQVWLPVTIYAAVFEGMLPLMSRAYTADTLDIAAYATGALAFGRWVNRPL